MTANDLLSDLSAMNKFTAQMAHLGMMNVPGSAFRCHPQMYWKNGILITNHWTTWNKCTISIATIPTTNLNYGVNDSWSRGNPYPSVKEGKLVCVWDGKWIKIGPWCIKIENLLIELINEMRAKIEKQEEEAKILRENYQKKKQDQEELLLKNWS